MYPYPSAFWYISRGHPTNQQPLLLKSRCAVPCCTFRNGTGSFFDGASGEVCPSQPGTGSDNLEWILLLRGTFVVVHDFTTVNAAGVFGSTFVFERCQFTSILMG